MVNTPGEYTQVSPTATLNPMGNPARPPLPLPSRYGFDYYASTGPHPADPACFPIYPAAAAKVCYICSVLSQHPLLPLVLFSTGS